MINYHCLPLSLPYPPHSSRSEVRVYCSSQSRYIHHLSASFSQSSLRTLQGLYYWTYSPGTKYYSLSLLFWFYSRHLRSFYVLLSRSSSPWVSALFLLWLSRSSSSTKMNHLAKNLNQIKDISTVSRVWPEARRRLRSFSGTETKTISDSFLRIVV